MKDLTTAGLRRTERLARLGLWGLMPRPVYDALTWCTFSGVPLPPPLRQGQRIALALDDAVNAVLDDRIAHPTDSADLLNVLFHADNGTWPRKRIRDEALTFMLAGHETTANAMSWLWYLMSLNIPMRGIGCWPRSTTSSVTGARPPPTLTGCRGPPRASRNRNATSRRCG